MGLYIGARKEGMLPEFVEQSLKSGYLTTPRKWGVRFDGENPGGTRTYNAAGMVWQRSCNSVAGRDDFKVASRIFNPRLCLTKYDLSKGKRVVVAYEGDSNWAAAVKNTNLDYMREFVPFYYQRPSKYEWIISDTPLPGFNIDPMHYHKGRVYEKVRISAYKVGDGWKSRPGINPIVSQSQNSFKNNFKNRGWRVIDYPAWCSIVMLGLVKYANLNFQNTIAKGNTSTNDRLVTGNTQSVKGLDGSPTNNTTTNESMRMFGIENFYGDLYTLMEGIYFNANKIYLKESLDIDKNIVVGDLTEANGFRQVGTIPNAGVTWIKNFAYDSRCDWGMWAVEGGDPHPTEDTFTAGTGFYVAIMGGGYNENTYCGPFYMNATWNPDSAGANVGCFAMEFDEEDNG